jgi:two-component system response regulator CpxR
MRPKKTILCVDDNEQALSVRKFLLETRGYKVVTATSGAEALAVLRKASQGSVDLLLTDLGMPVLDGNDLILQAKLLHPALPALLLTGTARHFDRATRADVYLSKGADSPLELLERVRVLVMRKRGPKKAVAAAAPSIVSVAAKSQGDAAVAS